MKRFRFGFVTLLAAALFPIRATAILAQGVEAPAVGAQRSMVTRAELQTALDEIQRGLSSSGYSQSLRSAKQKEATAIKSRLDEGDLRSGDEIKVDVLAEPGLSAVYTVTPARTIVLPAGYEVSMRGVLRSEVQGYLTTQLKRYVNDPNVTASASVRIAIFGGVGKPGFYNVPANKLLSKMLQDDAGGPANNFKPEKSQILRDDKVFIDGPEFSAALYKGVTLDQLNIQAGDVIQIAVKPSTSTLVSVLGVVSGLAGLIFIVRQISRSGP